MGELIYKCPHCSERFPVSEDSDEYFVPCPNCGASIDLTELAPEQQAPSGGEELGVAIEETVIEGIASDPAAKAIQDAIGKTSVVAGNIAANGLCTFRMLRQSLSSSLAKPKPPPGASTKATPAQSPLTLGAAFAPARHDPAEVEAMSATTKTFPATIEDFATCYVAFSEGRTEDAVAGFRRAAQGGDREAMIALAGCLLRGIGCRPDLLSARLWQSRAHASPSDAEAMLHSLALRE